MSTTDKNIFTHAQTRAHIGRIYLYSFGYRIVIIFTVVDVFVVVVVMIILFNDIITYETVVFYSSSFYLYDQHRSQFHSAEIPFHLTHT